MNIPIIKRKLLQIRRVLRTALIGDLIEEHARIKEFIEWKEMGMPAPPPDLVKHITVKEYARKYGIKIFIESGTYLGQMVYAMRNIFDAIYSIELDEKLYKRAKKLFKRLNHISIYQGDSGQVLSHILPNVKAPCLFWLDAHYSGGITAKGRTETPILQEIGNIINHSLKEYVILIDDARNFIGENNYPTIKELQSLVLREMPDYIFEVKHDIIRIHKS